MHLNQNASLVKSSNTFKSDHPTVRPSATFFMETLLAPGSYEYILEESDFDKITTLPTDQTVEADEWDRLPRRLRVHPGNEECIFTQTLDLDWQTTIHFTPKDSNDSNDSRIQSTAIGESPYANTSTSRTVAIDTTGACSSSSIKCTRARNDDERVPIYDQDKQCVISGRASPRKCKLGEYLKKHPRRCPYIRGVHDVKSDSRHRTPVFNTRTGKWLVGNCAPLTKECIDYLQKNPHMTTECICDRTAFAYMCRCENRLSRFDASGTKHMKKRRRECK